MVGAAHRRGADRGAAGRARRGRSRGRSTTRRSVTLTRREQAKAAELTAAGHPVTASAVAKRRRRYQEQGLAGMVDHRAGRRMPPHGRADAAVVAAMRQAIGEAARGVDADGGVRVLADEADPRRGTAGEAVGAAVGADPLPPVRTGWWQAGTRPGRPAPAGRWPPAPRGRSGRWRVARPAR